MSTERIQKLTEAEYLRLERAADFKSEFFDGAMVATPVVSFPNNLAKANLCSLIGNQLDATDCHVLSSTMRIKVEAIGFYAYPDILIVSGKPHLLDEEQDILLNPMVIVEVTSPATWKYDRGAKFRRYQRIETLKEYVLVAEDEPVCERFVRQSENSWTHEFFVGLEAELVLVSVEARVRLADIYDGVEFPVPGSESEDCPHPGW